MGAGARRGCIFALAGLLAGLAGLTGCAGHSRSFAPIERCLATQRPADALALLDAQRHAGRDRLLYLLNRAMLLRLTGDLAASNAHFEQAKALIDALSALSVSEQAASFLVNDATRSYEGQPHEQVLLHVYAALNYLEEGRRDEARVEALQVDLRLRQLAERAPESPFRADPFARYLTGLLYEERGEWSDALIAYRKAFEAYQDHGERYPLAVPRWLQADLLRLTERMGLHDEGERYREAFGDVPAEGSPLEEGLGEVVLLLHSGLAPVKREESLALPDPASGLLVSVSLPRYERRPRYAQGARVAAGDRIAHTELVQDIEAIALANHEALLPGTTARALARAVAKFAAAKSVQKQNEAASVLLNLAALLTERADTRSWLTLPAQIQMARVALEAGDHHVTVEVLGAADRVLCRQEFPGVRVEPGRRTYLSYHWAEP